MCYDLLKEGKVLKRVDQLDRLEHKVDKERLYQGTSQANSVEDVLQLVICYMLEKLFYEDRVNFRHRLEPSAKDYRLQKQLQKLVLNHFADQVVPAV